jgi:hypothetical protein
MKEFERGERRFIEVYVDMHHREAAVFEACETVRNPTAMELTLAETLSSCSRAMRSSASRSPARHASRRPPTSASSSVGSERPSNESHRWCAPSRVVQCVQYEERTLAVSHAALGSVAAHAASGNAARNRVQQLATVERKTRKVTPLRLEFGQTARQRPREVVRIDQQMMATRDARQMFRPGTPSFVKRPDIAIQEISQRQAESLLNGSENDARLCDRTLSEIAHEMITRVRRVRVGRINRLPMRRRSDPRSTSLRFPRWGTFASRRRTLVSNNSVWLLRNVSRELHHPPRAAYVRISPDISGTRLLLAVAKRAIVRRIAPANP